MVDIWKVLKRTGTILYAIGGLTYILGAGAGLMAINNKFKASSHESKADRILYTMNLCSDYPKDSRCSPNLGQQLAFHQASEELYRRRFEKLETIMGYTPFPHVNSGLGYVFTTVGTHLDNLLEPEKPTALRRNTF